jgi:hypothetical protein
MLWWGQTLKYRRSCPPLDPRCAHPKPLWFAALALALPLPLLRIVALSPPLASKDTTQTALLHSRFFHSHSITASTRSTTELSPFQFNNTRCAPRNTTTFTMDSMPIRIPSSSALDVLLKRPTGEAPISKHVENASPPTVSHEEHLPSGISETDAEKKERWFIGSIDCGTTSSRFLIFNGQGVPVASHQIEFENIYPQSG